jgi:DNA polymerase elongation subunit (family B)
MTRSRNIKENTDRPQSANAGFDIFDEINDHARRPNGVVDASDFIVDVREYDVPYHVRVAIDKGAHTFK